jgi:hypothetical protein
MSKPKNEDAPTSIVSNSGDDDSHIHVERSIDARLSDVEEWNRLLLWKQGLIEALKRLDGQKLSLIVSIFALSGFCVAAGNHMRERQNVYASNRLVGVMAMLVVRIGIIGPCAELFLQRRMFPCCGNNTDLLLTSFLGLFIFMGFSSSDCMTSVLAALTIYALLAIPEFYLATALQQISATENPRRHLLGHLVGAVAQCAAAILVLVVSRRPTPLAVVGGTFFCLAVLWRAFSKALTVVATASSDGDETAASRGTGGASAVVAAARASESEREELVVVEDAQGNVITPPPPAPAASAAEQKPAAPASSAAAAGEDSVVAALARIKRKQQQLEAALAASPALIISAYGILRRVNVFALIAGFFAATTCLAVTNYTPRRERSILYRPTLPAPDTPAPGVYPPWRQPQPGYNPHGNTFGAGGGPASSGGRPWRNRRRVPAQEEQFNKRGAEPQAYGDAGDVNVGGWRRSSPWQQQQQQQQREGDLDPRWSLPNNGNPYVRRSVNFNCGRRTQYQYSIAWPGARTYTQDTITVHGYWRGLRGSTTATLLFATELMFFSHLYGQQQRPFQFLFATARNLRIFLLVAAMCVVALSTPPIFATEAAFTIIVILPFVAYAEKRKNDHVGVARTYDTEFDVGALLEHDGLPAPPVTEIDYERNGYEFGICFVCVAFAMRHIHSGETPRPTSYSFFVALAMYGLMCFAVFKAMYRGRP